MRYVERARSLRPSRAFEYPTKHRRLSLAVARASVFSVSFFAYGQLGGTDGVLLPYEAGSSSMAPRSTSR